MTVLDASAVLALVHDEPGADVVAAAIASATLGTANLAEVIGKLVDADIDIGRVRELLAAAGVTVDPVSQGDPELTRRCASSAGALLVASRPLLPDARGSQCARPSPNGGQGLGQPRAARRGPIDQVDHAIPTRSAPCPRPVEKGFQRIL